VSDDINNKVARTTIPLEFIKDALLFPEDSKIIGCKIKRHSDDGIFSGPHPDCFAIELILQHKDLPVVKDGNIIPEINPIYHSKAINMRSRACFIEFDWNL
jgi:hypothetical protein